jgi:site-specific recombinase XerC
MSDTTFEKYFTVEEERRLLRAVAQYGDPYARRDHAWMRLLRHSGIRVGTLAGLTVLDAQRALRERRLELRREISKGGRGYAVPLNRKAREALRDLLRIRRELGHAPNPDAPLVMSRNHRGMSVRSFQARGQHWAQLAGLPFSANPHRWRHTLGKRIQAQSTSPDPRGIAQRVLGHASINSTAIYTQPDREDLALAVEEAA